MATNRKSVILVQGMAGSLFTLNPGQLVECTSEQAERMIADGSARELEKEEPTAKQSANKFTFGQDDQLEAADTSDAKPAPESKTTAPKRTKATAKPA